MNEITATEVATTMTNGVMAKARENLARHRSLVKKTILAGRSCDNDELQGRVSVLEWTIFDGLTGMLRCLNYKEDVNFYHFLCRRTKSEHLYSGLYDRSALYVDEILQTALDQVGIKAEDWETWTDEQKAHLRLLLP